MKSRRQSLRSTAPKAEVVLWQYLKRKGIHGLRFHRQYGVGPYIVDFYCPRLRLAIELNGDSHFTPDAIEYDKVRQTFIESLNIRFLRFTNDEVYGNLDGVIEMIQRVTSTLSQPVNPPPLIPLR